MPGNICMLNRCECEMGSSKQKAPHQARALENGQCLTLRPRKPIYTRFQGNSENAVDKKNYLRGGGHLMIGGKLNNLIRSSPYSWVTSRKKLERSNNYFSSYGVNKEFSN